MYKKCYSVTKLKSFGPNVNELSEIMIDDRMSSTARQCTLNHFEIHVLPTFGGSIEKAGISGGSFAVFWTDSFIFSGLLK